MKTVRFGFEIKRLTCFTGESDSETNVGESEAQILIESRESKPAVEINESKE